MDVSPRDLRPSRESRLMQEPEPSPGPERPDSTSAWRALGAPAARPPRDDEQATVMSGSAARRPGGVAGDGSVALPRPGDRIDSFVLEESIGVGGMGAVFRALDERLDRHVALKI